MKRFLHHNLKLRMLRAIDAIDKHQSLLGASRALSVTQPALTRTLQEVEAVLGGKIFDRHARGVRLTPFGEIACTASRRILSEVQRLDHSLDKFLAAESSVVSLGATAPAAVGILPQVYELLGAEAPAVRIELTQGRTEDLMPLLTGGDIEMIVGRLPPTEGDDEFMREVLYDEPLSIFCSASHSIFTHRKVTLRTLQKYRYILPTMSRFVESEVDGTLAGLGLLDLVAHRSSSFPFIRELLHTSEYLTVSPHFTLGGDLKRGSIRRVPFRVSEVPRPAGFLLLRDHSLNSAASKVHAVLSDYLRTLKSEVPDQR
jgi:LysR family transcriptional regulator, pca operon transcriptional activator